MTAAVTLLCLVACPSEPPLLFEEVYEEWTTHLPETTYTLEPQAVFTPRRWRWSPAVEAWRPLVAGHFGDLGSEAVDTVLCLMGFESGGLATARNPSSGASGLMQVLPSWAPKFELQVSDLETPEINLWVARQLYDGGGWDHWAPYLRGECHL